MQPVVSSRIKKDGFFKKVFKPFHNAFATTQQQEMANGFALVKKRAWRSFRYTKNKKLFI